MTAVYFEPLPDIPGDQLVPVMAPSSSIQGNCNKTPVYFPCQHIDDLIPISKNKSHFYPHWELSSTIYRVCFRLKDSVPREQLDKWLTARQHYLDILKRKTSLYHVEDIKRLQYLYSENIEKYLNSGYGECILANPEIAAIVMDALKHFDTMKYSLHAWCIMPNHVHAIFQLLENYQMREVVHGWKSFTSHRINQKLHRSRSVWQCDYYNHIIRSEKEYFKQVRYVWNNPVKVRFAYNWPWRWMVLDE